MGTVKSTAPCQRFFSRLCRSWLRPTTEDVSAFGQHRKFPPQARKTSGTQGTKNVLQPIKITIQIWVVMRHWYGIFVLVLQTLFCGETSIGVAKCQLIQCFHWLCYGEI